MPDVDIDVAVVGAGVVGLACAAAFARRGHSVVVIERHARPAEETSSRNSGVIHAGLYYPTGSLKARSCVRGRELLYARCERFGVAHRRIGKLVVATDPEEEERLEVLCRRGLDNGGGELRLLERSELRRMEPNVQATLGMWSPRTGIVDQHELANSYQAEAVDHGAEVAFRTHVTALQAVACGWRVHVQDPGGAPFAITARVLVNAAGLAADRVAEMAGLDVDALSLRQHYCKGDYFSVAPRLRHVVRHLVYPMPVRAGLGIHVTKDLGDQLTAGPDATYVDRIDYDVDASKRHRFGEALRRYLPCVGDDDLQPGYAGMRPKLQGPGDGFRDFVVEEASRHGAPGLINLIGIESPGLTASEALAEEAVRVAVDTALAS